CTEDRSALETCASGAWSSMNCSGVCAVIGSSAAACVACDPSAFDGTCVNNESGVGQLTTCTGSGSLATDPCPGDASCSSGTACGVCKNGDIHSECSGANQQECMAGAWVEKPCPEGQTCSGGACITPPTTGGTGGSGGNGGATSTDGTNSSGGASSTTLGAGGSP